MQTRQWMTTHEWMVKPMPQKEWIERRGMLVWISEVFTGLGSGLYLVSLFLNNWWGMAVGWMIIVFLKIPVHLAYFGKPLRFYRTMPPFSNAWKTSWSARGVVFTIFFTVLAMFQLIVGHPWVESIIGPAARPLFWVFGVPAGFFALLTSIYCGFIMNQCKGIPFWNTGVLPIVFPLAGIAEGFGLLMGIGLASGGVNMAAAEMWSRVTLTINAFIMIIYLVNASCNSTVGKLSVSELIVGKVSAVFWIGLVGLGIVIPLTISVSSLYADAGVSSWMLIGAIICHTSGAFSLKYCLLKVGIYRPIIPKVSAL